MSKVTDNLVINQYKLLNCLASGQYSQVWEAIDNETTRRVAMKLLLPEALKDPEQLASLKSEFKIGSSFEHPNIIKYHEISVKKTHAFFTMDLFAAPNLKGWVVNDLRGIHIRFKRLIEFVALALEQIHERGWVHRDLKPDNILMNKSAEVRVIDFSLACRAATTFSKMFARKQLTVKGTRTYMAPEQILGKALTPQTDIYNFGITIFELLTGQAPYAGSTPKDLLLRHIGEIPPNPSDINTNITPEMDRVILRMIAKKPDQRQKSMSEFLVELRNVSVFKVPIAEEGEQTEQQMADEALKKVLGGTLDSRADALRTKLGGGVSPPAPLRKPKPKSTLKRTASAAPQPAAPQMMPGMMPQMPMQPQAPMYPYPMQPMPGMPMPYPMQQPMQPMPMPGGQTPWVAVPQAPAAGPQAPRLTPPAAVPPPAAAASARPHVPVAQVHVAQVHVAQVPVAPPQAARPLPPPVAATAIPTVATKAAASAAPVQAPASKPAPVRAVRAKPAAPAAKPDEGMRIDDLLGFDDLPPAV